MRNDIGMFVFLGIENKSDGDTTGIGVGVEVRNAGDARRVGEADPDGGGGRGEVRRVREAAGDGGRGEGSG